MAALLDGRVAIVTGGGRGIGRVTAAALVSAGANVVIADNGTAADGSGADPTIARDVAKALGKTAIAFTDSVASPGAAKAAVDLAVRAFGGIDIVVNNVVIRRDAPVWRADPHDWEAVIRANLFAPFYLTAAASAIMRAQGRAGRSGTGEDRGRIINILGSAGLGAGAGQASYASAKAGLLSLTQVAAMDLAPARITVNAVLPLPRVGATDTVAPDRDTPRGDAAGAVVADVHPVANLAVALCCPAALSISGQLLGVRHRELFLFGQPWPAARRVDTDTDGSPDALIAALLRSGAGTPVDPTADPGPLSTETVN